MRMMIVPAVVSAVLVSFSVSGVGIQNALAAGEKAKTVQIDSEASKISWFGKKTLVDGKHNGTVKLKKGEVRLAGGKLSGGSFEIDMTSIVDEDLTDKEWNTKLVNHLKSDDFFAVSKHPVSVFKVTGVKELKKKDATHEITGDLTIKGITHKVTFPALVKTEGGKTRATAKMAIDRAKWDVRYGSGKFFKGLGDKMIDDEIRFDLNLVTK